jgi:RNA polymerase sigma factor (sigma-70 family)
MTMAKRPAKRTADRRAADRHSVPAASIPPFQTFLDEQRETVYRFLVASVGSVEADDCFQETFLSALRAYPSLRHGSNLRSWVLTIATRKAIDAARSRARRPVAVDDVSAVGDRAGDEDTGSALADESLWNAVRALPARQRAAVVHRYVLDRSYAEVAEALGTTEETARKHVSLGVKQLREEWQRDATD